MANPLIVASTIAVAPAVMRPRAVPWRRQDESLSPGRLGHDALHVTGPDPRITASVRVHDTVVGADAAAAGPVPAREEH